MLALLLAFAADPAVRFATFNVQELSNAKLAEVDGMGRGTNPQLQAAAAVLQELRPDVLLVNEIDGPVPGRPDAAALFLKRFLAAPQAGRPALDYSHVFHGETNTGDPSGIDLDNDGKADGPNDAWGHGKYPGEYGMALYSRFPIDRAKVRTFRKFLWKDLPGHLMPDGQGSRPAFYSAKQAAVLRLSSKSHWLVPLDLGGKTVHAVCSHPTPPIFDGKEDRNGRRNHDELRLLADLLPGGKSEYLTDDQGRQGGLPAGASFVVLGDLNAEPARWEAKDFPAPPIHQVLKHAAVHDPAPRSKGAEADAKGPKNLEGYRPFKTSHFGRIDYALPSRDLQCLGAGVHWPGPGEPGHERAALASDHRLTWVDVARP